MTMTVATRLDAEPSAPRVVCRVVGAIVVAAIRSVCGLTGRAVRRDLTVLGLLLAASIVIAGCSETGVRPPTGVSSSSSSTGGASLTPTGGTSSTSTPSIGTSTAPSPVAPSSTPRPPAPPASSAPPSGSTSAIPTGTPTPAAALRNLVLTQPVRVQLVRAYVLAHQYQPEWITSTRTGSVYYAYDSASSTYLAWAAFEPAPGAQEKVYVVMQDEGVMTSFHERSGAPWETYDICTTPAFLAFVGGVLPAGRHC